MKPIPSIHVLSTLSVLSESKIPLRLLRNINNELPNRLDSGKDIDILIHWQNWKEIHSILHHSGFKQTPHPLGKDQFLYGVHPFRFYKSVRATFFIDCHFELACRSFNHGEWIPLDRIIQHRAWISIGYHHIGRLIVPGLDPVCEWIHLLTRCIFDRRGFDEGYILRIEELTNQKSDGELSELGRLVFFKFTGHLLSLIKAGRYKDIITEYLSFMDY